MKNEMFYQEIWTQYSIEKQRQFLRDLSEQKKVPFVFEEDTKEVGYFYQEKDVNRENPFVFVPGKRDVILGYQVDEENELPFELQACILQDLEGERAYKSDCIREIRQELKAAAEKDDRQTIDELNEYLEELNQDSRTYEGIVEMIMEHLSPVRKVTIGPMIVEQDFKGVSVQKLGHWRVDGTLNETLPPEAVETAAHLYEVNKNQGNLHSFRNEYYQFLKLSYEEETYLVEKITPYEKQLKEEGLFMPTEDEWEYLCAGGKRTFFRWGDEFDYGKLDDGFEEDECKTCFNIFMDYNPYFYELVDSPCMTKGGDGGCAICGGEGEFNSFFPLSTFYRQKKNCTDSSKKRLGEGFYYFRRIYRL